MTLAEDVAHKLGWIKREDGFWAYSDVDCIAGTGFAWQDDCYPIFRPDIQLEHTAYVKRDIESRGLCWSCTSPVKQAKGPSVISFIIISLESPESCIHIFAETEEVACCLAFLEIPETSIPETKGENSDS